jgi:hypothetical protein
MIDLAPTPPPAYWSVIWISHSAPQVRSYLWTVGVRETAEKALEVAGAEAVGDGEDERPAVRSPDPDAALTIPKPTIRRGTPHWAVMWKSNLGPRVRHLLHRVPQRTWEAALETAQRELVQLGTTAPPLARTYAHGTFYPVRMDMNIRGVKGTFYPVLASAGVEVYEDPTISQVVEAKGG